MTHNPAAEVIVAAFDKIGDVIAVSIPVIFAIYALIRVGDHAINFLRSTVDRTGSNDYGVSPADSVLRSQGYKDYNEGAG